MAKKLSVAEILAAAKAAPKPPPQPPKPVRQRHELRTTAADEATIYEAVIEFWQLVARVAHLDSGEPWDVLICQLTDSGRISALAAQCLLPFRYPRQESDLELHEETPDHFRFSKTWEEVDLIVAEHETQLDAMWESCERDEVAGEQGFQQLLNRKVQLLRATANDSRVAGLWDDLPSFRGAFAAAESDTPPHEFNLIPIFGQSFLPEQPQTALEVFSRLYHQTNHAIDKNRGLKFKNKELVSINLTGRSTTDETIALLEPIDRLAELCQHVQQIDLSKSAVTAAGLAKLVKLLPHVKIIR